LIVKVFIKRKTTIDKVTKLRQGNINRDFSLTSYITRNVLNIGLLPPLII